MQMGVGGGVKFSRKKRYEGVRFNVISVTRGWVGVQFPEKKRYVTLEWPHCRTPSPQSSSSTCKGHTPTITPEPYCTVYPSITPHPHLCSSHIPTITHCQPVTLHYPHLNHYHSNDLSPLQWPFITVCGYNRHVVNIPVWYLEQLEPLRYVS